jgi:hypothetical protein
MNREEGSTDTARNENMAGTWGLEPQTSTVSILRYTT